MTVYLIITIIKKAIDNIEVIQYCLCTLNVSGSAAPGCHFICCFICAETKVQIMVQHPMHWSQTKGGYDVLRSISSNYQTHPENDPYREASGWRFVPSHELSAIEMVGCSPWETHVCLAGTNLTVGSASATVNRQDSGLLREITVLWIQFGQTHGNLMWLAAVFKVMLPLACSVMDGTKQCSAG